METLLQENLQKNEHVLWTGKAGPFRPLDRTNKRRILTEAILSALAALALLTVYALAVIRGGASFQLLIPLMMLLLCGIVPLRDLSDCAKLRKAPYAVTDQRLIVVSAAVRGVELSRVREAAFKQDADGLVSLLCGEDALKARPSKWREVCVVARSGGEDENLPCSSFGCYAVEDAAGLKKVLQRCLPQVRG